MNESQIQIAAIKILRQVLPPKFPHLCPVIDGEAKIPVHSTPNEGRRNPVNGKRMKDMGMQAGIPDLAVMVPCGGYHGMWIEVKTPNGPIRKNQVAWLDFYMYYGYKCLVARSVDEIVSAVVDYLTSENEA